MRALLHRAINSLYTRKDRDGSGFSHLTALGRLRYLGRLTR